MPAAVLCPACNTSLTLTNPPPTGATCPRCGGAVPASAVTAADRTSTLGQEPAANPATSQTREFPFLAPPQTADEIGRLGPYRVLGTLGAGGMGAVFLAEDPALRRKVALKVMLPQYAGNEQAKARFLREARAQAAVEHDHVAAIFQVGEDRGVPFLAMPLLKGMTLADALRANPRVPLAEAVRVAREVAEGLAAAHETGLVHRDVKPANVWLEGRGLRVKLLDFGLARAAEDGTTDGDPVTREGMVVGTPAYMSPEQARGEKVDGRTDLFSLGCVLYQMLAGRPPFAAPNVTGLLIAVATQNPPPPSELNPEVSPALDALTMRLLAKDPAGRPPTAAAAAAELLAAGTMLGLTGVIPVPVSAPPAGTPAAPDPWEALMNTEAEVSAVPAAEVAIPADPTVARAAVERPAPARGRSGPWLLVGALLFAGVAVAAVVVILNKIRNPGGEPEARGPEVGGPDPAPVAPPKGVKPPAKTTPNPSAEPGLTDAQRKTLNWVLQVGGNLDVVANGTQRNYKTGDPIPDGSIQVKTIRLGYIGGVIDDAAIENLKDAPPVEVLGLSGSAVTDAGVARLAAFPGTSQALHLSLPGRVTDGMVPHLAKFPRLTIIGFEGASITDDGLAAISKLPQASRLTGLNLGSNRLTDACVKHFREFRALEDLSLFPAVTDAGLAEIRDLKLRILALRNCRSITADGFAHLGGMTTLRKLYLHASNLDDAGLAHLKNLTELDTLQVSGTRVTDAGLDTLLGFKNLKGLSLTVVPAGGAGVTPAGLARLRDMPALHDLTLYGPGVTDDTLDQVARFTGLGYAYLSEKDVTKAGAERLAAALPKCKVILDGTQVVPGNLTDAQRKSLNWVLQVGGTLVTNRGILYGNDGHRLPDGPIVVKSISLGYIKSVIDDAAIENLKDAPPVDLLGLTGSAVTDAGIARLTTFPLASQVSTLGLGKVTDAVVPHLAKFPRLMLLSFEGSALTDDGVAALSKLPQAPRLTKLQLHGTHVTAAGVKHIREFRALEELAVPAVVTDAGLAEIRDLKLHTLWMGGRMLTAAGFAHLKGMTTLRTLRLVNSSIDDAGLAQLKSLAELEILYLQGTRVTDAGLETLLTFKKLKNVQLTVVPAGEAGVTAAGLARLRDLPASCSLTLSGTALTDAGLEHLAALTNLPAVNFRDTAVTRAGAAKLAAALPKCKVSLNDMYVVPGK